MLNQWISGVLGIVTVLVPFLSLSETAFTWLLVIVGLTISVSSFWGMLFEESSTDRKTHGAQSRV